MRRVNGSLAGSFSRWIGPANHTEEDDMVLSWLDCIAIGIIVAFVLDLRR